MAFQLFLDFLPRIFLSCLVYLFYYPFNKLVIIVDKLAFALEFLFLFFIFFDFLLLLFNDSLQIFYLFLVPSLLHCRELAEIFFQSLAESFKFLFLKALVEFKLERGGI